MYKKDYLVKSLTVIYFLVAFIDIGAEYLLYKHLIVVLRPLLAVIILFLYLLVSKKKNILFLGMLMTSSVGTVLFGLNEPSYLFFGVLISAVTRILQISLIFSLQKIKDFIPWIIATIPFLLFFFYLFVETVEIPQNSFFVLILHSVLISLLAGISLSSYVMYDSKKNSLLLLSATLFVLVQFIVFSQKYFLMNEFEDLFGSLTMVFYCFALFSFYKYVVLAERLNNNNGTAF